MGRSRHIVDGSDIAVDSHDQHAVSFLGRAEVCSVHAHHRHNILGIRFVRAQLHKVSGTVLIAFLLQSWN